MLLRSSLSHKWTKYIQQVADSLNSIPLKKLGFLAPNQISNEASSALVDKTLKDNGLPIPKELTYTVQATTSEQYEKNAKNNEKLLKIGDFVYKNYYKDLFSKSFDAQANAFDKTKQIL